VLWIRIRSDFETFSRIRIQNEYVKYVFMEDPKKIIPDPQH
jgi:hypothetical protein